MIDLSPQAVAVLLHYTPPVEVGPKPALFLLMPGNQPREVELEDLADLSLPLITHSSSLLVDWAKIRNIKLPTTIVELDGAVKLLSGVQRGAAWRLQAPSSLRALLLPTLEPEVEAERWTRFLEPSALPNCERSELIDKGFKIVAAMARAWEGIRNELASRDELDRFAQIEVPCHNLFLRVQRQGIALDTELCERFIDEVEANYERALHWLTFKQRIDIDRALRDSEYLAASASLPIERAEFERPATAIIEQWRHVSPICGGLSQLQSLRLSRDVLLRSLGVDCVRCWVTFDTMGTVTGRILAVDPHLQYLKKRYRQVLLPDSGREFVYLDFSQYEPSIMAAMSRDEPFATLCSEGDVYRAIGAKIAKVDLTRDELKLLLLSYFYGMGKRGLATLVQSLRPDAVTVAKEIERELQSVLAGVDQWKDQIWIALEQHGRIGTAKGNYRYRREKGALTDRERRWAVSQVVQGTGALILKELCLKIDQEMPDVRVVLPVHDALLLEVPAKESRPLTATASSIFRDVFGAYCSGVEVRVEARAFAEVDAESPQAF